MELKAVQQALCEFIIRATEKDAPDYAVQALPEATRALIQLSEFIQVRTRLSK